MTYILKTIDTVHRLAPIYSDHIFIVFSRFAKVIMVVAMETLILCMCIRFKATVFRYAHDSWPKMVFILRFSKPFHIVASRGDCMRYEYQSFISKQLFFSVYLFLDLILDFDIKSFHFETVC